MVPRFTAIRATPEDLMIRHSAIHPDFGQLRVSQVAAPRVTFSHRPFRRDERASVDIAMAWFSEAVPSFPGRDEERLIPVARHSRRLRNYCPPVAEIRPIIHHEIIPSLELPYSRMLHRGEASRDRLCIDLDWIAATVSRSAGSLLRWLRIPHPSCDNAQASGRDEKRRGTERATQGGPNSRSCPNARKPMIWFFLRSLGHRMSSLPSRGACHSTH